MTTAGTAIQAALQHATTLAFDAPGHAARALHQALAGHDPATAPADADLISAVVLYLDCLADGDADDVAFLLPWARYAVAASGVLQGPAHPGTIEAVHALLWALETACTHRAWPPGLTRELVQTRNLLIGAYAVRHGPHAPITLIARTHRAVARHHLGHCRRAIADLIHTWTLHHHHGSDDAIVLVITAEVLRACQARRRAANWLGKHLALLSAGAVADAMGLYEDPDFGSPIDVAGHWRVCTYPRPNPHAGLRASGPSRARHRRLRQRARAWRSRRALDTSRGPVMTDGDLRDDELARLVARDDWSALSDDELARLVGFVLNPDWNRPVPPTELQVRKIVQAAQQRRRQCARGRWATVARIGLALVNKATGLRRPRINPTDSPSPVQHRGRGRSGTR